MNDGNPDIRVFGSFAAGIIIEADPAVNLRGSRGVHGLILTPYQARRLMSKLRDLELGRT